ncbi:MAG: MFS transporter [Verrucomicrobia bacterium CG_4_10_14_3_um_filter_43_23]|nr:MAG: hypothetical protein AUJ82_02315 [Verrucomicrobia bacterium CG1_02_43_26]PIP58851.1 MAG: MFS transporter [Verrucomicrobia bacterium CG22_combo_CG10-13_8_21_14_all_43_17]PIX57775.1 MAG: MFS transporter [Verrucomicrobia bacterium CG_4_10_14_3_um_filter_43_23]PIY61059.1 MAG: MFS transporter [Verrucomicrobia bacterium CG_4_10_14_0_8_um_filter_43_34]PJA44243.1 MAG: MFS transporter [Verrucomicrobia bacterium CG_4_9_14_3_um_filter_43_20]
MTNTPDIKKINRKRTMVLFLNIFLNLAGFAIILPLGPAIMQHYVELSQSTGGSSMLTAWIRFSEEMAKLIGHENPVHITQVFFGCMLGALYALGQFLFAPFWGRLSDRFGRRPILLVTIIGTGLSYIIWFFAGTFELFIISRALAGIMAGNLAVSTAAMADITTRADRAKGMGIIGAAFGLGFILGPAIGGISSQFNFLQYFPSLGAYGVSPFSMPALIACALCVLNLIWIMTKFPETLEESQRGQSDVLTWKDRILGMFVQGTRPIRLTNKIYLCYIIVFSGMEFTLPFLASERFGYSPKANGYLFVYIGFVLVFVQGFLVRKLAAPFGEKNLALIGNVSGLISFLIISLTHSENLFFLGCAFLALSVGLVTPSLSALVSLFSDERNQGRYLGLFRSAGSLARVLGPVTAALLFFYFGARETYLFAAGLLILPVFMIFFVPEPKKMTLRQGVTLPEENEEISVSVRQD